MPMTHRMTFRKGKLIRCEDIFDTLARAQMLWDTAASGGKEQVAG